MVTVLTSGCMDVPENEYFTTEHPPNKTDITNKAAISNFFIFINSFARRDLFFVRLRADVILLNPTVKGSLGDSDLGGREFPVAAVLFKGFLDHP